MEFPSGSKTDVAEKYIDMVYRICVGKLYDYFPSAIDDACQQVFLNFVNKNPAFKDTEHEKAWFIRVAVNVCNNLYKQRKRNASIIQSAEDTELPYIQQFYSDENDIMQLITKLPDKLRDVFYMYYIEEYDTNEIAKILGLTGVTVRARLKRARDTLKKSITGGQNLAACFFVRV